MLDWVLAQLIPCLVGLWPNQASHQNQLGRAQPSYLLQVITMWKKQKQKKDFHLEQLIFFYIDFFYVFPIIYLAREKQDFSYLNIYEKYPTLSIHCFYFISI
jgi:hypothetical protein